MLLVVVPRSAFAIIKHQLANAGPSWRKKRGRRGERATGRVGTDNKCC